MQSLVFFRNEPRKLFIPLSPGRPHQNSHTTDWQVAESGFYEVIGARLPPLKISGRYRS